MAQNADSLLKYASMETDWAKHIGDVVDLDLAQLIPSIFRIPDSVKAADPQSFSPLLVGLGPLHHFQTPLWELKAMKRRFIQQSLRRFFFNRDFRDFAGQLVAPLLPLIRAQYDDAANFLDIKDSTLAALVAIDCLFLMELLLLAAGSSLSPSPEADSEKSSRLGALLMNDALMLENQIPLFLLIDPASCHLDLARVCDRISPLKLQEARRQPVHLLEYLYFGIVGGFGDSLTSSSLYHSFDSSAVAQVFETVPAGLLIGERAEGGDDVEVTDVLKFAAKKAGGSWVGGALSWCLDLGIFKFLNRYLQEEEALIPAASQLAHGLGLKFLCKGTTTITTISFNKLEKTLCLPAFTITPNSQVLMKNLVAYESLARSQYPQLLTKYLELMRCLVRSSKDAELLREAGVLVVVDDDDVSAVALFGRIGTSAAVVWGGETALDSEIAAVNDCYYSNVGIMIWRVLNMGIKLGLRILILMTAVGAVVYFIAKLLPKVLRLDIADCMSLWYGI